MGRGLAVEGPPSSGGAACGVEVWNSEAGPPYRHRAAPTMCGVHVECNAKGHEQVADLSMHGDAVCAVLCCVCVCVCVCVCIATRDNFDNRTRRLHLGDKEV